MSAPITKFCKDCAKYVAPDMCYVRNGVDVVTGEALPVYQECRKRRTYELDDCCGPAAVYFEPRPDGKPIAPSSLGFILKT